MDHHSTATPDVAFRRLVETSPDAICVHDGKVVQYANPAAATILDAASPAEIVGARIDEFIHVDSRRVLHDRIGALMGGTPTTSTVLAHVVRPGGRIRTIEARSVPTTWDGGPAIMSVVRDLTGPSTAEESARVAERRLAEIVDSLVVGVVVQDRRGYVRSVNPAAAAIFGMDAREIVGTDLPAQLLERGRVSRTDGKMIAPAELPHRRARETGQPASFDLEIARPDGSLVMIRGTTTLVGVDHSQLVISSFADVTPTTTRRNSCAIRHGTTR